MSTLHLPSGDEQFDVAFSFVDRYDLSVAMALNALLEPELKSFVYVHEQELVGGGDGMTAYADIFRNRTRLSVILLREEWKTKPWCGIEEAAIKERALHTRHRSYMIVAMEQGIASPDWVPDWIIYQHGWKEPRAETATVIKARAREAGAVLKVETAVDVMRKGAQRAQLQQERLDFLSSSKGAAAAREEADRLANEVERLAIEMMGAVPGIKLGFWRDQTLARREWRVESARGTLFFIWNQPYSNSLTNARLAVQGPWVQTRPDFTYHEFALTEDGTPGWRWDPNYDSDSSSLLLLGGEREVEPTLQFADNYMRRMAEHLFAR